MTQIGKKRGVAAIFELGVWTLVSDFAVYFLNLMVRLLQVEININSEEMKCEDCKYRPVGAVDAAHEASSFRTPTWNWDRRVK